MSLKKWPLRPEVKAKVFLIVGPVQILTSHERFSFLEVVNQSLDIQVLVEVGHVGWQNSLFLSYKKSIAHPCAN